MFAAIARGSIVVFAVAAGWQSRGRPRDEAFAQRARASCRRDGDCIIAARECCEPCGQYGEEAVRAMPWPEYRRFRVRCRSAMCPACVSHPDPRLAAVCRTGVCQVETR